MNGFDTLEKAQNLTCTRFFYGLCHPKLVVTQVSVVLKKGHKISKVILFCVARSSLFLLPFYVLHFPELFMLKHETIFVFCPRIRLILNFIL